MPNTATLVRDNLANFNGHAKLYKLSEPVTFDDDHTTDYIVVSASVVPFSGPETYIFPANKNGNVIHWCELDGSYRGGLDHAKALVNGGYEPA